MSTNDHKLLIENRSHKSFKTLMSQCKCSGQEKNSIYDTQICKVIDDLKSQRDELDALIERQKAEKVRLQAEIERLTYKVGLVNKSLQQRIETRANYDKTILEAEKAYYRLVESSNILLTTVQREQGQLENVMNKNVNTSDANVTCCKSKACPENINALEGNAKYCTETENGQRFHCITSNCPELLAQGKHAKEASHEQRHCTKADCPEFTGQENLDEQTELEAATSSKQRKKKHQHHQSQEQQPTELNNT